MDDGCECKGARLVATWAKLVDSKHYIRNQAQRATWRHYAEFVHWKSLKLDSDKHTFRWRNRAKHLASKWLNPIASSKVPLADNIEHKRRRRHSAFISRFLRTVRILHSKMDRFWLQVLSYWAQETNARYSLSLARITSDPMHQSSSTARLLHLHLQWDRTPIPRLLLRSKVWLWSSSAQQLYRALRLTSAQFLPHPSPNAKPSLPDNTTTLIISILILTQKGHKRDYSYWSSCVWYQLSRTQTIRFVVARPHMQINRQALGANSSKQAILAVHWADQNRWATVWTLPVSTHWGQVPQWTNGRWRLRSSEPR